jgi:precorrin-6A synthase
VRTLHVIGIGAGDPDYVTTQAISALNDTDVFFAMDKGETKDDLVALRRLICDRFITEPSYRFVELPDPKRAAAADSAAYRDNVNEWHAARARLWAQAIQDELGPDGVGAFLAWGDPSLYDSTLRILERVAEHVEFDFDVVPGITAIRQLRENGLDADAVVMLDGECSFLSCPPDTRIWWGAYLGTPDELLESGRVGDVGDRIVARRAEARQRHGWIMDIYLLRA